MSSKNLRGRGKKMHELAVCQGLMSEVERVVELERASAVSAVVLRIGPLSGVEPELLRAAFPIAAAGGPAAGARLDIETSAVTVSCPDCGAISDATPRRLLCAACGNWRVSVVSGDELLLKSLELITASDEAVEGT